MNSVLFDIKYGVNLELNALERCKKNNGVPLVSRTSKNNGISAYVKTLDNIEPNPPNTISVACGGSVMASFLQKEEYYSGKDLFYLTPKQTLNDNEMLFYCLILRNNEYRYSFGRQTNRTLDDLLIPAISEIPKWVYENGLVPHLSNKPFHNKGISLNNGEMLEIQTWRSFILNDIFEVTGSKTTSIISLKNYGIGTYPYITTQATDNGTKGHFNYYTEEGNCLTIDSAVIGYCAYQSKSFIESIHCDVFSNNY